MSPVVEEYYKKANTPAFLLKQKTAKLERNSDIQSEFEYWIKNHEYKSTDCVTVEGYTASSLAALSSYLVGEGAFMMLIELREKPERAKAKISDGFKIK